MYCATYAVLLMTLIVVVIPLFTGEVIGLYAGPICIIYGTCTFTPPVGTWPGDKVPRVSPAVGGTMILSCTYFLVYTVEQSHGRGRR